MFVKYFNRIDLEWWLAKRDIVTTELDEDPRSSPRKHISVFKGMRSKLDADLDDGFDSDS